MALDGQAICATRRGGTTLPALSLLSRRSNENKQQRLLRKVVEQAESGRRLVIYEQETGFLAPWYMRLRVLEECARSTRYARPLTLIVLQVQPEYTRPLIEWLLRGLRTTDLVSRTMDGDNFLLLTETDAEGASRVMKRLLSEIPATQISSATFLSEAERFRSLLVPLDKG